MVCEKLSSLSGCNKCEYSIDNTKLLTTIRPEAIARICLYISQDKDIETKLINPKSIKVCCSGTISFDQLSLNTEENHKIFKQNVAICGMITNNWYTTNSQSSETLVGYTIKNVASNIKSLSNVYSLRHYFIYLVKTLRDLTICDKMCNHITINKEISSCHFKLGNSIDVAKITDPIIILEALRMAIYSYKTTTINKAYIDISDISVSCNGTINLPSKFIHAEDPAKYMRDMCVEVLKSWLRKYYYHKEAMTILEVTNECMKAINCDDLYISLRNGAAKIEAHMFFDD